MDLLKIYYYTGVPILTCNMLFYSVNALSSSITSSQNVVKFITEHKVCDSTIFKNELEQLDIQHKLTIVDSLIFDIIKRYCQNNDEFEKIRTNIKNPIMNQELDDSSEFMIIELTHKNSVFERIHEPVKYALMSTCEIIQKINDIVQSAKIKILKHDQSYLNRIVSISLQEELSGLNKQVKLLDGRLYLLFELLKIYK